MLISKNRPRQGFISLADNSGIQDSFSKMELGYDF